MTAATQPPLLRLTLLVLALEVMPTLGLRWAGPNNFTIGPHGFPLFKSKTSRLTSVRGVTRNNDVLLRQLEHLMLTVQASRNVTAWSITFVGDSLIYYQWQYLCRLLAHDVSDPTQVEMGWFPHPAVVKYSYKCFVPRFNLTLYLDEFSSHDMHGPRRDSPYMHTANRAQATLQRLRAIGNNRLDVVYFDMGCAHLLHMHPLRNWSAGPEDYDASMWKADYFGNRHYEDRLVEDINAYSAAGAWAVLPMMCHSICTKVFYGPYADWTERNVHLSKKMAFWPFQRPLGRCVQWVRSNDRTVARKPTALLRELCLNTSLTEAGSSNLAERMRMQLGEVPNFPNVISVDAHAMTRDRCQDTLDGVHYHPIIPKSLTHMLKAAESLVDVQ